MPLNMVQYSKGTVNSCPPSHQFLSSEGNFYPGVVHSAFSFQYASVFIVPSLVALDPQFPDLSFWDSLGLFCSHLSSLHQPISAESCLLTLRRSLPAAPAWHLARQHLTLRGQGQAGRGPRAWRCDAEMDVCARSERLSEGGSCAGSATLTHLWGWGFSFPEPQGRRSV